MTNFNWTCPRCNTRQTVTNPVHDQKLGRLDIGKTSKGYLAYQIISVACVNEDCGREMIVFRYGTTKFGPEYVNTGVEEELGSARFPSSLAKPQPAYIPPSIVEDYNEASEIAALSPKAAATLARRCIQGMIRDFCGIAKKRLVDEISALEKLAKDDALPRGVTPESIDAIDAVRRIGNIGAHMEADINLIVDVDTDEAMTLIHLIETLFDDWYVARNKREERFAGVRAIAAAKAQVKLASPVEQPSSATS